MGAPGKVLLIQLRRIGDAVLITPALDAIRETWPETRIHLLTEAPVPDLFVGDPRVDAVWVRPLRARLLPFAASLRREGFDLVFDFQSLPVTSFLGWATRAYTVGFRKRFRHQSRSVLLEDHRGNDHAADHKLDLLRSVGLPAPYRNPRLHPPPAPHPLWDELPPGAPRVALVPISPWAHKRWDPEAWSETARLLHRRTGAVFAVLGGPGEEETVEATASGLSGVPHLSRNLHRLREFTEALAGADLFLGNDCGPRHMAAALGLPTIAYFRDVNPSHWTPPEAKHPVLWDTTLARGRPVSEDLRILPVEPEAAAGAAADLLKERR